MKLQDLLLSLPAARFLEEYFCKLPYSTAGGCAGFAHLGSWEVIGELLSSGKADLLIARGNQRWEGADPTSAAEGRALVAEGYTLGFRQAQRHHTGLAELAANFRDEFCAPVEIHLYCTPAGRPGFSWHYDAEEVFVLQTQGSKEWSLRKNTVNPWPLIETLPQDMRYEREIMPLVRCKLAAGDWLYIPNGYWHSTQAGEESISLSVGIEAPAAIHLYDLLRPQLLQSLRWRQRLPALGPAAGLSREDLVCRYKAILAELSQDLSRFLRQDETLDNLLAGLEDRGSR